MPNGRALDAEHYQYKLRWLERLVAHLEPSPRPTTPVVVAGDFNIAPTDVDVYDPAAFEGATHVSPPERDALAGADATGAWPTCSAALPGRRPGVLVVGLPPRRLPRGPRHAHRPRAGARRRSPTASSGCVIDRNARKGQQPSDHAPVIVDLAD